MPTRLTFTQFRRALTAGFALGDFGIDYAQGYCIARPEALATARAQVRTLRSA